MGKLYFLHLSYQHLSIISKTENEIKIQKERSNETTLMDIRNYSVQFLRHERKNLIQYELLFSLINKTLTF